MCEGRTCQSTPANVRALSSLFLLSLFFVCSACPFFSLCTWSSSPTCVQYVHPAADWGHEGQLSAVIGGFVYRATQFPAAFQGSYFFGDYGLKFIRYMRFDATSMQAVSVQTFDAFAGACTACMQL